MGRFSNRLTDTSAVHVNRGYIFCIVSKALMEESIGTQVGVCVASPNTHIMVE